jgi:hypothetical protein
MFFAGLLLALILGCIPGAIAQSKGHSFAGWWIFGALLFIVALPMSLMLSPKRDEYADQINALAFAAAHRKCPSCAEMVKREAVICRFCGRDLPVAPAKPSMDPAMWT